ncbi:hypothetical protein D9M72_358510 [compost metagenome]
MASAGPRVNDTAQTRAICSLGQRASSSAGTASSQRVSRRMRPCASRSSAAPSSNGSARASAPAAKACSMAGTGRPCDSYQRDADRCSCGTESGMACASWPRRKPENRL